MSSTEPSPRTWTLRFKQQRTTILVEVDPLQHLSNVRANLLEAIRETNPSGKLNGQEIPKNPEDILLGKAVDRNNLSMGYELIKKEDDGAETSGKGKGKGAVGSGAKGVAQMKDCPQGAGLRNSDVVAFKFKSGDEDGEERLDKWDVKIPTMEETYGDEDAQQPDEGIGLEDD